MHADLTANPIALIHGDSQTSFLYTLQQFLHVCLIIVPIVHIIAKISLKSSEDKIQGVDVFYCSSMVLAWLIALIVLRHESFQFFKAKVQTHSFGLVLFWSLSFLTENMSFISWNNSNWWFHLKSTLDELELGLFITRYVCMLMLFLIGMKGPGLYKTQPMFVAHKQEGPSDATNVVS